MSRISQIDNEVKLYQKKIINFLSLPKLEEIEYSAEPKIDGISTSLIYKNGILDTGLSRGDEPYIVSRIGGHGRRLNRGTRLFPRKRAATDFKRISRYLRSCAEM